VNEERHSHRPSPPSAQPRRWAGALLLGVLLAAAGPAARVAADTVPRPLTAADCKSLLHQFDVAAKAHQSAPHAEAARKSRDLGDAACTAGHFADGVHQLRHALHDIGVKPVKAVAASPSH
jgi:hypothetical protein